MGYKRTRVNPTASIHMSTIFRPQYPTSQPTNRYSDGAGMEWAFASIGLSLTGTSHSRLWDTINTYQQKLSRRI